MMILDIPIIDHVIVGDKDYCSFSEGGLILVFCEQIKNVIIPYNRGCI